MNRYELIGELARLIQRLSDEHEKMDPHLAARELQAIAAGVREGGGQLPLATAPDEPLVEPTITDADRIAEVHGYWLMRTGKQTRRMLPERVAKIRQRLRTFTVEELKRAIDGALLSEHHTEGGYLDIMTLFKNNAVVEQHIERAGGMPTQAPAGNEDPEVERLRMLVREAKESGDTKSYNELNAQLRKALQRRKK